MKFGISLVTRTGRSIEELMARATADRLVLAKKHASSARTLSSHARPEYRQMVSRGYYSMYHCFRAVVFFMNAGDEHEKHSELPEHVPKDFPSVLRWKSDLKTARLERNRADYEPYPRNERRFKSMAESIVANAEELLPLARTYLRSKGCSL